MATRTIGTDIVLTGEKAFNDAIFKMQYPNGLPPMEEFISGNYDRSKYYTMGNNCSICAGTEIKNNPKTRIYKHYHSIIRCFLLCYCNRECNSSYSRQNIKPLAVHNHSCCYVCY